MRHLLLYEDLDRWTKELYSIRTTISLGNPSNMSSLHTRIGNQLEPYIRDRWDVIEKRQWLSTNFVISDSIAWEEFHSFIKELCAKNTSNKIIFIRGRISQSDDYDEDINFSLGFNDDGPKTIELVK